MFFELKYALCGSVQMESSYFIASRHKLDAFCSLIFRFSSCHHPLLASTLAKVMQDQANHVAITNQENALRQLISMINNDDRHVVCSLDNLNFSL